MDSIINQVGDTMGMYSTFIEQDIQYSEHREELKKLRSEIDHMDLISENGVVNFHEWSGQKIEGYWYEETVDVLRKIAPFIEGTADFFYEEGWGFRLLFKDKKVYYQRQQKTYTDPEELQK